MNEEIENNEFESDFEQVLRPKGLMILKARSDQ